MKDELMQHVKANIELSILNAELEERLLERTSDWEAANKELEEFLYIASHDLQAPLRKLQMFTTILNEELEADQTEGISRAMSAIDSAVRQMQDLVFSLLRLSRVRRKELKLVDTDLNQILQTAVSNLSFQIEESKAELHLGPLPRIACDTVLITQVFHNLAENALKYVSKGVAPVISITAEDLGHEVRIAIGDNGIGIAEDARRKIFSPFHRLHPRHEYPGVGLGLYICENVVSRHRGKIWVESEVGQGSSFYFKLPKEPWKSPDE